MKRWAKLREIENRWLKSKVTEGSQLRADIVDLMNIIYQMEDDHRRVLNFHRTAYRWVKRKLDHARRFDPPLCACQADQEIVPILPVGANLPDAHDN